MDPDREPIQPPEYVDWPGRGRANLQPLRGMSDYERGAGTAGSANYVTEDGAMLRLRNGVRWQAQYKNYTTKWKVTAEEAIQDLENRNAEH